MSALVSVGAMTTHTAPPNSHAGLLDEQEAANYLSTSPRHVRELWSRRELAGVKVGRLVRFRVEDIDAYIAGHRVAPTPACRAR